MSKTYKTICVFILVILFSPGLILILCDIFPNTPWSIRMERPQLAGVELDQKLPSVSWKSLISGEVIKAFQPWFNQHYGLKEFFVKLNNQIYYTSFKKSYMYSGNIVIGKNGYLYEKAYLDDYFGYVEPILPSDQEKLVRKLGEIQQKLKERGISFIVLITPSKAYTVPEYIPDNYRPKDQPKCTYDMIMPLFDKYHINIVDGQRIILDAKRKSVYPLFCKGGTHWNSLGASTILFPLIEKIEAMRECQLSHINIKTLKVDYYPKGTDRDLTALLNLFQPDDHYLTPHPDFQITRTNSHQNISALFVGGSFNWMPLEVISKYRLMEPVDFHYYYHLKHVKYKNAKVVQDSADDLEKLGWESYVFKHNVIVLEINTVAFGSYHVENFTNDLLRHLK